MNVKIKWTILIAVGVLSILVLCTQVGAFGNNSRSYKLEGAWIARVTSLSFMLDISPLPFQWSYIIAPNPSGRTAALHGTVDVSFPHNPLLPPSDYHSPLIAEIVMTGPDTAEFDSYWHYIAIGDPFDEVTKIGRSHGEIRFLSPRKLEVTHHFEIYSPGPDFDEDPFSLGALLFEFTATTVDTRLPFSPGE